MGSSQSKRNKEPSIHSSYRRSVAVKASGSSTLSSGKTTISTNTTTSTHTIKPKSSFIRPSSSTLSPSAKQQAQKVQQQDSAVTVARPPIFAGIQSNSFFLPKNWQAEDADYGLHFALKLLFSSGVLSQALPRFTRNACIIEIGCHRGSWLLDMATQYPDCHFIGFDKSLDRLPDGLPLLNNAQFQVANVPQGGKGSIPLKDESVDVVTLRAQNALMDHEGWKNTFEEAHRVLKPGGLIHIMDYCHKPTGSVLIESFTDTIRGIMSSLNRDTDRATKLGAQLPSFGFQVIQTLVKQLQYGASNGKLGEAFTAVALHRYEEMAHVLAPAMGLSLDDYRHRVEMVMAQCVNANSTLTWYAYVAKKITIPSSAPSPHHT
ncbi:S-adenosyl-L-methionine-dependent methyltransferase [Chlamydoabsidia padenii]|nr:S-adenosyl-L-methionine-dependent methyltransferase [Chlamydoabsidia padenii]